MAASSDGLSQLQDPGRRDGGQMSYSNASSLVTEKVLSCLFQKTDVTVDYKLTSVDIAKVIYQVLNIPEGRVLGYDEHAFRRLRIFVDPSLPLEKHMISTGVYIRNGLRLEPMKKASNDFWIKILKYLNICILSINYSEDLEQK